MSVPTVNSIEPSLDNATEDEASDIQDNSATDSSSYGKIESVLRSVYEIGRAHV